MATTAVSLAIAAMTSAHAEPELIAAGPQTLPPVFVTATRFADDAATLPFGVRVITADDIRRAGVGTVNEALMKLLGVPGRQDSYGAGDYAIDLRGYGDTARDNQVVVLDGVRLNEADLSSARLAGIPIDSVERIEVVRGSGSVLYGEGASAGVIIVTTRAGSRAARNSSARVSAVAGSYGLRELRTGATVVAGDFSIDATANRRLADNHRDNFRSAVTSSSVSGQWQFEQMLRLGLGHAEDRLDTGLPGALSSAQYASDPSQTNNPDDRASIGNRRNTLFGQLTLGDWQVAIDVGTRTKALTSMSSGFPYDYDVDAGSESLRARHTLRGDGIANTLAVGLDHGRWQRDVHGGAVSTQQSHGVYVRDEFTLPTRTRLSAGLRRESVHKGNSGASVDVDARQRAWELGLLQPVGDTASIYLRSGKSFRLPNVDEFGYTTPGSSLRPQTSRDDELGARWAADGSHLEARLYRSTLTDEIGFDPAVPGPFGPGGANVNFDPTRRQGLEIEASQDLAESLTLHAIVAQRRATFRAGAYDGKDVPLTPRRTVSLRAEWEPTDAQQVDVLLNRVGPQQPDFANQCRMPAYTTLDLRYAYRWSHVELALGVTNATDHKFYTQAYGCVGGVVESIYPDAGRAVSGSVRLTF